MYKVTLLYDARLDMSRLFTYISADNVTAAKKMREQLHSKMAGLATFPFKYPAIDQDDILGDESEYRYVSVGTYLIFYQVLESENEVVILRVLHSRQNWLQLLFGFNES